MTCGNRDCEWYSDVREDHCKATHCYESTEKFQGSKDHMFFAPELCSLFISKQQFEKVRQWR